MSLIKDLKYHAKSTFSRLFMFFIKIDFLNKIINQLEKIKTYAHYGHSHKYLNSLLKDLIVRSGPFQGLVYPDFISHGSALYSKLLGCYESELHGIINNLITQKYETIIDIGCAEGYYAVGMAQKQPQAKVYAIDVNLKALDACKKMAEINNVSNRIFLYDFCDTKILYGMLSGKTLIICDCEGYEIELFKDGSGEIFKSCDLLIELHDSVNINISGTIKQVFNLTHSLQNYYSMSDEMKFSLQKSKFGYEILKSFDYRTQYRAITDLRAVANEWLFCKQIDNDQTVSL